MTANPDRITRRQNPYTGKITWEHSTPHNHSFFEIVLIVKGSTKHFVNGNQFTLKKYDLTILKPNDVHYFKLIDSNYEHRDLYVNCNDMKEICNMLGEGVYDYFVNPIVKQYSMTEQEAQFIINYCNKFDNIIEFHKNNFHLAIFKSVIAQLLGLFIENDYANCPKYPSWLIKTLDSITTETILTKTLSDYVEDSGYSHTHFCRIFKQYMHQTFVSYIAGIKLDYSLKLLSDKELSILDISNLLGYDSVSHYITSFKNRFSITPNKYRVNRLFNTY